MTQIVSCLMQQAELHHKEIVMTALAEMVYFTDVIDAMKTRGFSVFSMVAITTDDFRFHVKASYARNTRLFFHSPAGNCIIVLSYTEHDYGEGSPMKGYWNIRLDLEYRLAIQYDEDERPIKPACEGFHHAGWSSCGGQNATYNLDQTDWYERDGALPASELADAVQDLLKNELSELAPVPFEELQVTSWDPSFVFPKCSPLFWERFKESSARLTRNRRYLWSLVKHPWGSEGLKR